MSMIWCHEVRLSRTNLLQTHHITSDAHMTCVGGVGSVLRDVHTWIAATWPKALTTTWDDDERTQPLDDYGVLQQRDINPCPSLEAIGRYQLKDSLASIC
jgi:hypothetical protein